MMTWKYMTIEIRYQWLHDEERYRVWQYFPGDEPGAGLQEIQEEVPLSHSQFAGVLRSFLHIAGARGWELVNLPAICADGQSYLLLVTFKCPEAVHASSVEC